MYRADPERYNVRLIVLLTPGGKIMIQELITEKGNPTKCGIACKSSVVKRAVTSGSSA